MIHDTATDNENSGKTHRTPYYMQALARLCMCYKTILGRDGIQNFHKY